MSLFKKDPSFADKAGTVFLSSFHRAPIATSVATIMIGVVIYDIGSGITKKISSGIVAVYNRFTKKDAAPQS